jgi:acyl carrier protein
MLELVTGDDRVLEDGKTTMTRDEFLLGMDDILGLPPGTLQGNEKLEDLPNWDSAALIGLIVMAESENNAHLSLDQVVGCATVADLLRLAQVDTISS